MDKLLRCTLLYDFYGELLTEHQKLIYEDYVLNDLSLSEIAESNGISRQAVHDIVKRCEKALEGYEEKLHLLDKFLSSKKAVEKMNKLIVEYKNTGDDNIIGELETISNVILEKM